MEEDGQIRNEKISKEENENVGVCNAQWEGSLVTPLWEPFLPFCNPPMRYKAEHFPLTTFSNVEFSSRQFLLTFSGWFDIEGHMISDCGEKWRIAKPVGAVWLLAWFCLFLGLPARRGWSRKHLVSIIWDEELVDSNWEWLSVTSSSQKKWEHSSYPFNTYSKKLFMQIGSILLTSLICTTYLQIFECLSPCWHFNFQNRISLPPC